MTTQEVEIAVLTERFDQLRADHRALAASIQSLSETVAKLDKTVAAQTPWAAMFERFVVALVTGAVTWFVAKETR